MKEAVEKATLNPNNIARTMVGDVVVSTVYLPSELKVLDKALGTIGESMGYERAERLLTEGDYETMIFHCDEEGEITDWEELDFNRYSSEEEARNGHKEMVKKWEAK